MSDTSHGFGRVLVAVYAVFALAASARSIFQLATKAGDAPFAYSMSAFAGLVYVVATIALARSMRGPRHRCPVAGRRLAVPGPDGVVRLR
jgi:hypothetical protein